MNQSFSNNLKKARIERGLSQQALASKIFEICRDKVEGKEKEADLTTILNFRAMGTMSVLKDVLTIEGFDITKIHVTMTMRF